MSTGPLDVSLPMLTDASQNQGTLSVATAGIRSLSVPVLAKVGTLDVGSSKVVTLSLPALTTAGSINARSAGSLTSISAPVLTSLGGESDIFSDAALASVTLPSLATAQLLYFEADPLLTTLDLHSLASGLGLRLYGSGLTSMSFAALGSVNGNVEIQNNTALTSLSFPVLTSTTDLSLQGNTSLATLSLPMITTLGQLDLLNTLLTNLNMFATVHGPEAELEIGANPNLTDVTGLYGVTAVNGRLYVTNNTMLTTAHANALRDHIGTANITGTITISGNAP